MYSIHRNHVLSEQRQQVVRFKDSTNGWLHGSRPQALRAGPQSTAGLPARGAPPAALTQGNPEGAETGLTCHRQKLAPRFPGVTRAEAAS